MEKPITAQIPESNAGKAGALYAKSEIDAGEALALFARSVGTAPTYPVWIDNRKQWVDHYVAVKPQAKGNSADQAFLRFTRKLTDAYGLVAPKAQTEASIKKAEERAKKAQALEQRFNGYTDSQITGMLRTAYEEQAKNPTKKSALLRELETVAKQRTKRAQVEAGGALKAARTRLYDLAKACTDVDRIEAAADVLDLANYDVTIQTD